MPTPPYTKTRDGPPHPGSHLAVVVCDTSGTVLSSSYAAEQLLRDDGGVAWRENRARVGAFMALVVQGDEDVPQRWLPLRHPGTNEIVRAATLGLRIPGDDGRPVGAVGVMALSEPALGGYFPDEDFEVVSHQLRTPINAVVGYAALLQERLLGELSDDQERAVARIAAAAQQLLSAVNQALLMAHIEVGDFEAGDFATARRTMTEEDGELSGVDAAEHEPVQA